jgi:predicted dehydrogenase
MDLGVHTFDLLRYFVADASARIMTTSVGAAARSGGSAEHHASCLVTLATGAAGTVTVSWRDSTYRNRWYFTGERGALELDFTGGGAVTLHGPRGKKLLPLPAEQSSSTAQQAFVDRILAKKARSTQVPSAWGEDGCAALKLCLAALQSSRTNATVRLQPAARRRS